MSLQPGIMFIHIIPGNEPDSNCSNSDEPIELFREEMEFLNKPTVQYWVPLAFLLHH